MLTGSFLRLPAIKVMNMEQSRCNADAKHIRHFLDICDGNWHSCIYVRCVSCKTPGYCNGPHFLYHPDENGSPCILPMADARMLFTNVTDLREIENDFSFLSPEQIAAIRTFWSSFYPKGDTPNQEQFLAVWQILYALYTDLREALATEGKGYEGMIFREVVEQMEKDECCDLPYTKVVFVGLNALSVAENVSFPDCKNGE